MNILVCVKQVPDTTEIKIDPVKNTLIREGVPSIVNPFDGYALEAAARIRDKNPDTKIVVLSMGPEQAKAALKECLAIAADKAYLVSDRAFGGSDTLATSYIISETIKKVSELEGGFDAIFCGKQAIDGDTAQVGPQIAEKLNLPQVTYAEEIVSAENGVATVTRRIESGVETVKCPLPLVVTVNGSAAPCRPRNAKAIMKYKRAASMTEAGDDAAKKALLEERPYLLVNEWNAAYVDADLQQCGLAGSPTKVKAIENVVFTAKDARNIENNDAELEGLIKELIANHTIG